MSQLAIVTGHKRPRRLRQGSGISRRIPRMRQFCISGPFRRLLCTAAHLSAAVPATLCLASAAVAQEAAVAEVEARPEAVVAATEALPLNRLEAEIAFRELIGSEDYIAAVAIGERLLALELAEHGTQSVATGRALVELGEVQRRAGLLEEAELSFLNSIEIFRAVEGPFSENTIEPSIGLGDSYYDDRQFRNAVSAYNEARTTQRRAYGLLTEDQLQPMDRMTRAFQAMSMHEEADEQQRAAMLLVERINGPSDIETLEAIYRYGSWLRSVYRYEEERIQYERAIRIIRSEYDKDSLLLVTPYREIGNSFRSQGFESPRGASALNSALELLEERPDTDPVELAEAIIDVADWRTAFGTPGSGHEGYLRAWNLLGSAPDGENLRRALLRPRRANAVFAMNMSVRGLAQNPNDSNAVDGRVLVEFDVDPYGRPENATVRESDPPGFKDDAAVRAVRQSRFRPRIENGQFVFARRQGYLISFRYIPDDRD